MNTIIILLVSTIIMTAIAVLLHIHYKKPTVIDNEPDIITRQIEQDKRTMASIDSTLTLRFYYSVTIGVPVFFFFLLYAITGNILVSLTIFIITIITRVPIAVLRIFSGRTQRKFTSEYGKALDQMAASLTTGQNIQMAVSDVCESPFIGESVKKHFRKIEASLKMGIPIAEAFRAFANDTGNEYVNETAIAITVQSKFGNREAEVIQSIATQVKSDIINKSEINAIISSTSSSVAMMDVISPSIFIMGLLFNKDLLPTYLSSPQMTALGIVLIVMPLIGSFLNHKMLRAIKK